MSRHANKLTLTALLVGNPPDEFVRLLSGDLLGNRRFSATLKDQFSQLTKRAFEQLLTERINARLKGAMAAESPVFVEESAPIIPSSADDPEIITTAEEIEGLHIIRSILREVVSPRRIVMRDNLSYCAILLDDNNRKPVCRLRFNNTQKLAVGLFGADKNEERFSLQNIDDLYSFADQLRATVQMHLPAGN